MVCQLPDTSIITANSEPRAIIRLSRMLPPAEVTAWLRSRTTPARSGPMAVTASSFSMNLIWEVAG